MDANSQHWDRHIRRQRKITRSLHGRLYRTADGQLWLVSGEPDPDELLSCLRVLVQTPALDTGPTPVELGFAAGGDGAVTASLLAAIQQALVQWEAALEVQCRRGPRDRRTRERRDNELREIGRLSCRLRDCYRLLREARERRVVPGLPYVLYAVDESEFSRVLAVHHAQLLVPTFEKWLARLVMWLSGPRAAARFLSVVTALVDRPQSLAKTQALHHLRDHLLLLQHRSATEHNGWLHVELAERLNRLPAGLISPPGENVKRRGTFPELCQRLLVRCDRLLGGDVSLAPNYVPAAVAAVAACTEATTPLPAQLFRIKKTERNGVEVFALASTLIELSRKPGYEKLLTFLCQGSDATLEKNLPGVQQALARGVSGEEIRWLAQQPTGIRCLGSSKASAGWIRQAHGILARRKMAADDSLGALLVHTIVAGDYSSMQQWLAWLARLTPVTATPRIGQQLLSAMNELVFPALDQLKMHADFRDWTRAASIGRMPDSATGWLVRLHRLQQLIGKEVSVPKSIRKLLDYQSRAVEERAHLQRLITAGEASAGQISRHNYLDKLTPLVQSKASRLARAAEEAFIVVAFDALRTLIRHRAEVIWNQHSAWPGEEISLARLLAFAGWLQTMPEDSRQLHTEVMLAWQVHGGAYKQHLNRNRDWLSQAQAAGIDTNRWLNAEPLETEIAGRQVRICFADDPREIFLMGTYFRTCLSLGQFNQMSVVANAHDANKQVVYIYGERDGKRVALARLLVAVSSSFQLVRYCAYTVSENTSEAMQEAFVQALVDYAARRAQAAGIPLADAGEPTPLGVHFWYDDGEQAWPETAKEVWQAAEIQARLATVTLLVNPLPAMSLSDSVVV